MHTAHRDEKQDPRCFGWTVTEVLPAFRGDGQCSNRKPQCKHSATEYRGTFGETHSTRCALRDEHVTHRGRHQAVVSQEAKPPVLRHEPWLSSYNTGFPSQSQGLHGM